MDIPPPPPPPPSPDDAPPPGQNGPPPPPPYGGLPSYPQQPSPYGYPQPQTPPPQQSYGAAPGPYGYPAPYPQQQNPYGGPGGPPPYPGPGPGQPGWFAAERTTNGMSIAALVVGLIPCVPILGLIFGIVGLKQVKRRGERGKGMAVAGIALSSVWTLGLAAVITLGAVGVFDGGNTSVRDLQAGQCFNMKGKGLSGSEKGTRSTTVDVVDCGDEHDAEAFASYAIQSSRDDPYPGVDSITDDAQKTCSRYSETYLDGKPRPSDARLYFFLPPADGWAAHQRTVICFYGWPDGGSTGSVKAGDHESGVGV